MGQSIGEEAQRFIDSLRDPGAQAEPVQHVKVERPKGCVIIVGGSPSVVLKQKEIPDER